MTACRNRYSTDIPAFRAYLTNNTSIGSGTGVFTSGFSEIFDKQNNHNQTKRSLYLHTFFLKENCLVIVLNKKRIKKFSFFTFFVNLQSFLGKSSLNL